MDETNKLLEEIRDILRRSEEDRVAERAELRQWRAASDARASASVSAQRAHITLYRRMLVVAAVLVVALFLWLFNMATR